MPDAEAMYNFITTRADTSLKTLILDNVQIGPDHEKLAAKLHAYLLQLSPRTLTISMRQWDDDDVASLFNKWGTEQALMVRHEIHFEEDNISEALDEWAVVYAGRFFVKGCKVGRCEHCNRNSSRPRLLSRNTTDCWHFECRECRNKHSLDPDDQCLHCKERLCPRRDPQTCGDCGGGPYCQNWESDGDANCCYHRVCDACFETNDHEDCG